MIRKAVNNDLDGIVYLYNEIHSAEEAGLTATGWMRGVYPSRESALAALKRDDLFILEEGGHILASAVINQVQVDVYAHASWEHDVPENRVCVLHTLTVLPSVKGKGYGRAFLNFYEEYAGKLGCPELRIDTNEKNMAARAMYHNHGYREVGVVPTVFNGIPGVNLVLMEKYLGPEMIK